MNTDLILPEGVEPLAEEDPYVEPLDLERVAAYRQDMRNLVIAEGNPYILFKIVDPDTGSITVEHYGVNPAQVPIALRDIADQIEAAQVAAGE